MNGTVEFRKLFSAANATRCAATLAVLIAIAPGSAQTPTAIPDHSHARPYGSGWTCDYGYRQASGECAAVVVPAHAFLGTSGDTWECDRLYRKSGDGCVALGIPAHAFAEGTSGRGW